MTRQELWTLVGENVLVEWKARNKNVYLRLREDNTLHVTAPRRASRAFIRDFVLSHLDMVAKWRAERQKRPRIQDYQYVSGERFRLWGIEYTLQVIEWNESHEQNRQHERRVRIDGSKLILEIEPGSDVSERQNMIRDFFCREFEQAVCEELPICEKITQRKAGKIVYRSMTSRWGSCNVKTGRICLNLRLVHHPRQALHYIMIHELTHLWEANHGERFHALMNRFCPDWRQIRANLHM